MTTEASPLIEPVEINHQVSTSSTTGHGHGLDKLDHRGTGSVSTSSTTGLDRLGHRMLKER